MLSALVSITRVKFFPLMSVRMREMLVALRTFPYELANAVWQAERRGRIDASQADEILQAIAGLQIELLPLNWGEMLPLARRFTRSAYDAAYLALSERLGEPLVTGDERLYNAVGASLGNVIWLPAYGGDRPAAKAE